MLASTASLYAKVEVFEISKNNVDLLPGGKEADGIIGDFVIRNKAIECVIGGSADNRKANMGAFWGPDGVTPGCLYDLCLKGSNNDQLTIFSPSRQQGRVSYVRPSPSLGRPVTDGPASIRQEGLGQSSGRTQSIHRIRQAMLMLGSRMKKAMSLRGTTP
jgi:hypothetical protein